MKKILQLILGMLIGAAVGYGGVMLLVWLVDGGQPSASAGSEGIDWVRLSLAIAAAMVSGALAVVIHLILHEAGHLIAGLLTGFRFLSFRVFKYTLVKTDEGLRWKRYHIAGTGGQCLLELPEDQDVETAPWFWYNAGGVLMNLVLTVLSVLLLKWLNPGMVGFAFLAMMALVGLFMALVNGVPMLVGGVGNDGHNILLLWRHPSSRRYFVHSLQTIGQLSRGVRISDVPREWIDDCPVDEQSDYLQLSNRGSYMMLLEDLGEYERAREVTEELLSLGKKLPQLLQLEVGGDAVMLELMTTNRREVAERLWTKQLERYVKQNSQYSPIKCAVLYAYELLYRGDAEAADVYKQQLHQRRQDYAIPGEAITAISLIEAIDTKTLQSV